MSQTMLKTETCTCPGCSTLWIRNLDGGWWCDPDWGTVGYEDYRRDPLEGGRDYCPVCAVDTATHADRLRYVTQEQLQRDFLRWVLKVEDDAVECFRALLAPDPEWLEQRLEEYVKEEEESEFRAWRCGH